MVSLLMACGAEKGPEEDPLGEDGKSDSFRSPTPQGEIEWGTTDKAKFSNDTGWYHAWDFRLSGDAEVQLETKRSSKTMDTVMYLYKYNESTDRWGSYIAKNDDKSGRTRFSYLKEVLSEGTYRVLVKPYKKSGNYGTYKFITECAGDGCKVGALKLPVIPHPTGECLSNWSAIMMGTPISEIESGEQGYALDVVPDHKSSAEHLVAYYFLDSEVEDLIEWGDEFDPADEVPVWVISAEYSFGTFVDVSWPDASYYGARGLVDASGRLVSMTWYNQQDDIYPTDWFCGGYLDDVQEIDFDQYCDRAANYGFPSTEYDDDTLADEYHSEEEGYFYFDGADGLVDDDASGYVFPSDLVSVAFDLIEEKQGWDRSEGVAGDPVEWEVLESPSFESGIVQFVHGNTVHRIPVSYDDETTLLWLHSNSTGNAEMLCERVD